MDIRANIKILSGINFDEIKKNGKFTMILLKTYAAITGNEPKICEKCQKKYYNLIKSMENVSNSINRIKNGRLFYSRSLNKHIRLQLMSDKDAIELLKNKELKESDFSVLPENYKKQRVKGQRAKKEKEDKKETE